MNKLRTHSVMECEESKLARALRVRDRFTLAQRIGQRAAITGVNSSPQSQMVLRLFHALSPADQLAARGERHACLAAMRGETMAEVAA